jgi:hypothetical protein
MSGRLALVLAASIVLIGGAAGFALARDGHGDRGAMKEKLDTNNDGKLDDAERARAKEMKEARAARRAKQVAKFDTNNDGKLDDAERAALRKSRNAEMFKRLDKDGDGKLSLEEFSAGGGRGHGRHGKRH